MSTPLPQNFFLGDSTTFQKLSFEESAEYCHLSPKLTEILKVILFS